jgi:uncharacterized protein YjiK
MSLRRGGIVFEVDRAIDVGISEPSDVTELPGGAFFVVSDVEAAGMIVPRKGKPVRVELSAAAEGESGFEAVAFDAKRKRLLVVREEHHELAVLRWAGTARAQPALEQLRPLPAIGASAKDETKKKKDGKRGKKKKGKKDKKGKAGNKGVEGMAFLPASASPTKKAQLLLCKEAKPRALVLLDADGGGTPTEIALDPAIEAACADFSGLAVDPKSGHVFLCSDESATFAEIALVGGRTPRGELVAVTPLRDPDGEPLERVEGIAFDERGDLFVLLENDCVLWRFARKP